ncbi:hypothetical protein J1614_005915 [Plenodomus biglobosus]|nr:hypothetical protein J1614_005915 [Plenodomus biglobosus]
MLGNLLNKICSGSDGQHRISSRGLDRASAHQNKTLPTSASAIRRLPVYDPQETTSNITHALDLMGIGPATQGVIPA